LNKEVIGKNTAGNFSFIRATPQDLNIFLDINKNVQELHHLNQPTIFKPHDQVTIAAEEFEKLISKNGMSLFLVKSKTNFCAYVLFEVIKKKESIFKFEEKKIYLQQISVKEEFQGQGVASEILSFLKDQAKENGIRKIELDYWTFNKNAELFYKKNGFSPFNQKMFLNL
jgi:ribosomal protein S18 acetylase RimI-like enzyme